MVRINEDTALLDRAVFYNIRIKSIEDFEKLISKEILEPGLYKKIRYITESGQEFASLHIKGDGLIDKMTAGAKVIGNTRVDYCNLDTSIKNSQVGNLACYTVEQYTEQLERIQEQLSTAYGIETDFSHIALKEIEINKTFRLDGAFEDYARVLTLIMSNLPAAFKGQMDYINREQGIRKKNTYYASSAHSRKSTKYMLFKIYNKGKSVENTIVLDDTYMRVEIRLIGSEKVKNALGTNRFSELTDEIINQYFDAQMEKLIFKPYRQWKKKRDAYLLKLLKEQMQQNPRHWIVDTLRILQNEEIEKQSPVLLDVNEIMELIDRLTEDRKQRYKIKSSFRKQAQKYETVFCNNDDRKLAELNIKMSPT